MKRSAKLTKWNSGFALGLMLLMLLTAACQTSRPTSAAPLLSPKDRAIQAASRNSFTEADERDAIFMLLAYAVVEKDWQDNDMTKNRGYNIGSVLVKNDTHEVAFNATNAVNITHNMTQHGEVRLMNCYLAKYGSATMKDLKGYTLYTTLEPCAQCSGMMFLTNLPRVVYGQTDPSFGKAVERLELDSRALPMGYPPYPRSDIVHSEGSKALYRYYLDDLYEEYQKAHPDAHITEFLASPKIAQVYREAVHDLRHFEVTYPANQKILKQAIDYLDKKVPKQYEKICSEE